MLTSPFLERYVVRHHQALLTACGMLLVFCWMQSLSHLIASQRSHREHTPEHQLGYWLSPSPLTASVMRPWFAVFDLEGERHIVSAWYALSSRLLHMADRWPISVGLTGHGVIEKSACVQEHELFTGASIGNIDHESVARSLAGGSLR